MKKPKKNKPQPAPTKARPEASASASSAASFESTSGAAVPRVVVKDIGGEPIAGRAAVPVLLIALLGGLVFLADMHVVNHGGELDARVQGPFRTVKDLEDLQPKGEEDILKAKGQKVYKNFCSPCHQDDGNGNPSAFVPPLAGSDWVLPKDPHRVIRIVLNGLQGPITVNGKQWGQAAMLPWRDALNDEDVAAVVTYVRNSWGNKAPGTKAEEVKALREATKDKGGNWTAEELLAIPLKQ